MANVSEIKIDSDWGKEAPKLNANFNAINVELNKVKNTSTIKMPLFNSTSEASKYILSPYVGQMVLIGKALPAPVYKWNGSSWASAGFSAGNASVPLTEYLTFEVTGTIED